MSSTARAYRAAAPWLGAVWQFVGSAMVGSAVGYGVDWKFGSTPWGLAVGGVVGSTVGFVAFVRTTLKLAEKKK